MVLKAVFLLAMSALEMAIVAEMSVVNMKWVQDILAFVVALDYLLVAFSKGIVSAMGVYLTDCFHKRDVQNFVPIHAFGVKFQNTLFAAMFLEGVYVLPWLFKVSGEQDMRSICRIHTLFFLGCHHVLLVGFGTT